MDDNLARLSAVC